MIYTVYLMTEILKDFLLGKAHVMVGSVYLFSDCREK
jgi:hypothetical protein